MEKKKRGLGKSRCIRKSISITNEHECKLDRLSIACSLPPATIASIAVDIALNNPSFIIWIQDHYNKKPEFRTIPVVEGKKVILT